MKKFFIIFVILLFLLSSCESYITEPEVDAIATIANNAYWKYKTEIAEPSPTNTNTVTPTIEDTVTQILTNTQIPTKTLTPTSTQTKTFTPTATKTNTPLPTKTNTFTPTSIPKPTNTATQIPTIATTQSPSILKSYYVSNSGNNANLGTIDSPWKTLVYASGKIKAGDTLYIRGGTYKEVTSWSTDGTQNAPIKIMNYPGEQVIIDGYDTIPANTGGTWMFMIWGDWYYVSGLEITRSFDEGAIGVKGEYVTIDNCYIHHNWAAGITIMGNYGTAQNNKIWYNGIDNEFGSSSRGGWPATLTCARYPTHCTLKGNISWENWGEGISTFESSYVIIEDNISYDNLQNFYISDTQYSLVQRNFSYCTANNIVDPYSTQTGILVGDEKASSSNNKIINNIVYGCDRNLAIGTKESTNSLIANNTFVNADGDTNILMYSGTCTNCQFKNNLILQEGTISININGGTGWSFSNNLWSKTPSRVTGTNDIIGDPKLSKSGSYSSGEWYRLLYSSPAINKAIVISGIENDYFNFTRFNLPDIGAIEYH